MIRFTIPKGSLEKETIELLDRAMLKVYGHERTYRPLTSDPDLRFKLLRPQEIPTYVEQGLHDIGITGKDWVAETEAKVETLLDLEYGRVKLVAAIPKDNSANSLEELLSSLWSSNKPVRISTEYPNITSSYIVRLKSYRRHFGEEEPLVVTPWWKKGRNEMVRILLSFGATEAKPPEDADVIVDLTQTGTTLEQNGLKAVDVLMESTAVLIANPDALRDEGKREKIYDIVALLKGVVDGRKKLHIFLNVKKENLERLLAILPALKKPTISPLADEAWVSVNTVLEKGELMKIMPQLRRLAQGLVVHEARQIMSLEEIKPR